MTSSRTVFSVVQVSAAYAFDAKWASSSILNPPALLAEPTAKLAPALPYVPPAQMDLLWLREWTRANALPVSAPAPPVRAPPTTASPALKATPELRGNARMTGTFSSPSPLTQLPPLSCQKSIHSSQAFWALSGKTQPISTPSLLKALPRVQLLSEAQSRPRVAT